MIEPFADRPRAITLGADKGYDIDGRTTRHQSYGQSQRIRKRIEEAFGWIKTIAGLRKTRFIGRAKTALAFIFAAAAYNLVRLPKLIVEAA